jgi:hypothetical protein
MLKYYVKSSACLEGKVAENIGNIALRGRFAVESWNWEVASKRAHRARAQDREDLLHDIILTLAVAEWNNGHKPFSGTTMPRIASRTVAEPEPVGTGSGGKRRRKHNFGATREVGYEIRVLGAERV